MLDKEQKLNLILKYVEKHNVTAYSIAKATNISEAGIGKILNKSSKNPQERTVDVIFDHLFSNQRKTQNNIETPVSALLEPEATYNVLTQEEKRIITDSFLLKEDAVMKLPVVRIFFERERLRVENEIMREIKARESVSKVK